ncbi:MAG: DUF711 family protein [Anaerolineales bacterium]|nr:DUF711 family protein [Anaerolineales bacterium]
MKIRALTGFIDPDWPIRPDRIGAIGACLKDAKEVLEEADYEVQTIRLAIPPPSEMSSSVAPEDMVDFAKKLEAECFVHNIDYAALGPALPNDMGGYEVIPAILRRTEVIFASGLFADPTSGLSLPAARACAYVIHEASTIMSDGFANLRFAALANVASGSPFFPAAYHRGGPPAMAIATEAADLAVSAVEDASTIPLATQLMVEAIEGHAAVLSRKVQPIAWKHDVRFLGIDFSLAPYPEKARSLGTAIQAMGVPTAGLAGSTMVSAFLADCLDQAQFQRTGFCGLFFPVLEDSMLAASAADGQLSLNDLLLYATVCGTGLDTIPLPGDISPAEINAILVDLGALALRHDKQLTARLMPIPEKAPGDEIHFDFPYFADSCVLSLKAEPLKGHLGGDETIDIRPRPTVDAKPPVNR